MLSYLCLLVFHCSQCHQDKRVGGFGSQERLGTRNRRERRHQLGHAGQSWPPKTTLQNSFCQFETRPCLPLVKMKKKALLRDAVTYYFADFYRTRVRSLAMLVTHWLTDWLTPVLWTWLMWPWRVKMPTQSLLRLLLLLILVMRIVLATVCFRFGSWGHKA